VVSERRSEPFDLGVFTIAHRSQAQEYVLIKSRQHFRAGFEPIAKHIVMCDGDGCTASDLKLFKYTKVRRAALSVRSRHAARPQRVESSVHGKFTIPSSATASGRRHGKKLFAADVALKGDRIAAVEPPGTFARRQRDRRCGQGRGTGLHRRATPRRHLHHRPS